MSIVILMWDFFSPVDGHWYMWNLDGARVAVRATRVGATTRWEARLERADLAGLEAACRSHEVTSSFDTCEEADELSLPDSPAMVRVVPGEGRVALQAALPSLPLSFCLDPPLVLYPGASCCLEWDVPAGFLLVREDGLELFSFYPYLVPQTWNGDSVQGELCMDMEGHIGLSAREAVADSFVGAESLIHGRVMVSNRQKTPLELDRVVIHTDRLGLWREGTRLFTDDLHADGVLGEDGLRMLSRPAPEAHSGRAIAVAKPRLGQGDQLVRRSMGFIRSLTNL